MEKQDSARASSSLAEKALPRHGSEPQEGFMRRWLILPKLLYFMLNLFVYSLHSLIFYLFIKQWGFTYYMYGFATIIYAMNFFGAMIWSTLADKTGRYKIIIIVTSLFYTIIACLMLNFKTGQKEILSTGKMILVFAGFGAFNLFLSAAFPLVDAMILGMLSTMPGVSKDQFGYQRMWGAVGHFVATLLSMGIKEFFRESNFSIIIFQLVVALLFILIVWFGVKDVKPVRGGHHHHGTSSEKKGLVTPSPSPVGAQGNELHQVPVAQAIGMAPTPAPPSAADELVAEGQAGQKHPILALLMDPSFMFFMLFVACMGVVRAVSSSFQKPLMVKANRDDFITSALLDIGRMFSEIFVYLIAKPLKNAMGIYWLMIFSQVAGIGRILGYYFMPIHDRTMANTISAALELIKGFSSGLVSSSAIPIANRIAPPGCENSAQGLFSGNYSGLSMALGGLVGGLILKYYYQPHPDPQIDDYNQALDVQKMFLWVSVGCSVVTVLMMMKYIFIDRVMGLPGFPRRRSI